MNLYVRALFLDATEMSQDIPKELNKKAATYSNYKSRHSLKAVTGVAPNGTIVYSTDLYPSSVSDVAIVKHSNLLQQLDPGDLIFGRQGVHPPQVASFRCQPQHFTFFSW